MALVLAVASLPLSAAEWRPLWDGATFAGWRSIGRGEWTIESGAIRGRQVASEPEYGHLVTTTEYGDFTVRLKFKAVSGNSGFYFRIALEGFSGVTGFQAEIDAERDVGGLYETNGRAWVVQPTPDAVKTWFRPQEWNEMVVHAAGDAITVEVNGHRTAELRRDAGRRRGFLALQVHGSQDCDVWFKDLEIKTP